MKKKTTILSIFLAAFMALLLNVGNVKAAPTGQDIVNYAMKFRGTPYVWGEMIHQDLIVQDLFNMYIKCGRNKFTKRYIWTN